MLHRMIATLAAVMLAVSPAIADEAVTGFVAHGAGPLTGRITAADGTPLRNVDIHVVAKSGGEQIVSSDDDGNYRVELKGAAGEPSMVFVRSHPDARIGGQTAVSFAAGADDEAIEIRETLPPAVFAKPITNPAMIPDYSDAAIEKNVWAKSWLLLDVSETGTVVHVKFLKRPGFDLDPIAVRAGFNLKFEPARDRAKRPIRSLMLWAFEWPSYFWLVAHHQGLYRMPSDAAKVPCRKPGEVRWQSRDCAQPDMKQSLSERWIARTARPKVGR